MPAFRLTQLARQDLRAINLGARAERPLSE
ncbi:hypothetical protein GLO73106DRAFT_00026430 [Gloeocapsa sp. PCC 73106]|nr:hypothetical protein GLO73106DRAFT_00026430 [Gloeocapsa sp. PCC 73106]